MLRLLRALGAGNAQASDQMSDILAQVRPHLTLPAHMLAVFEQRHAAWLAYGGHQLQPCLCQQLSKCRLSSCLGLCKPDCALASTCSLPLRAERSPR